MACACSSSGAMAMIASGFCWRCCPESRASGRRGNPPAPAALFAGPAPARSTSRRAAGTRTGWAARRRRARATAGPGRKRPRAPAIDPSVQGRAGAGAAAARRQLFRGRARFLSRQRSLFQRWSATVCADWRRSEISIRRGGNFGRLCRIFDPSGSVTVANLTQVLPLPSGCNPKQAQPRPRPRLRAPSAWKSTSALFDCRSAPGRGPGWSAPWWVPWRLSRARRC